MMATDVDTTHGFAGGYASALFSGIYPVLQPVSNHDVSADGGRFITTKQVVGVEPETQIEIALNWTDELRRRVLSK